jgi:selenophosphate synthetase-related protein
MAACLDGRLRSEFGFYPSYKQRGARVRGDVDVLARVADAGAVVAAKDISMAGTLGTVAMLLQPTGSGAVVHLDRLPKPDDVDLATWLDVFPSYGFVLCAPPDRVANAIAAFTERDLVCSRIGTVDASGHLRIRLGSSETTVLDNTHTGATGLRD